MKRFLLATLLFLWGVTALAQECVVLLHGMARTERSMSKLGAELTKEGYFVVNYGYPSTSLDIEDIATSHTPEAVLGGVVNDAGTAIITLFYQP